MISFCVLGCFAHFLWTYCKKNDTWQIWPVTTCMFLTSCWKWSQSSLKYGGMLRMQTIMLELIHYMPIDCNGIWNVIRNVFSIFFTFVWCEVCVNKVYFWQNIKSETFWMPCSRSWRGLCWLWEILKFLLLQFSATSELVEKAIELESKCMQRKPEKWKLKIGTRLMKNIWFWCHLFCMITYL